MSLPFSQNDLVCIFLPDIIADEGSPVQSRDYFVYTPQNYDSGLSFSEALDSWQREAIKRNEGIIDVHD